MAGFNFDILEDTVEAREEYGYNYGAEFYIMRKEDIEALLKGKCLAATVNADEYSIFIRMKKED